MIVTHEQPRWILAIDDDRWALEVMSTTLGEHGWDVQRAMSGPEAQEILARLGSPALVLLDATMPNEDGFSICRRLRASASMRHVPIVFATALDDEKVRVEALEAGADDFLTKPVAASLLVTRVRTLIELHDRRASADAGKRYGIVLETIGEGVVTLDGKDNAIETNRAAVALLGLPRDPLATVHLPSHVARHWTVVRGQIGRNNDARLVYRTADGGATTAIDWTSRLLTDDGDEVWTVVIRDATDLWERDQALGRMMKSLGHKLRTPLTGLSAGLEFAREHQSDPLGAEMVEMAQKSAARLQDTIVRMLEYVDASGQPAPTERRRPAVAPEELVNALTESGIDEATTTLMRPVRVDTSLARRAVGELAANARAAGAGRVVLHVAPHPDRSVQFEITDDGPGFPAASENRVFEPFYQRDQTGEQPGAGLGLAILRADIGRVGGSIGAWSAPDRRTTVWFRLRDEAGPSRLEDSDGGAAPHDSIDSVRS